MKTRTQIRMPRKLRQAGENFCGWVVVNIKTNEILWHTAASNKYETYSHFLSEAHIPSWSAQLAHIAMSDAPVLPEGYRYRRLFINNTKLEIE